MSQSKYSKGSHDPSLYHNIPFFTYQSTFESQNHSPHKPDSVSTSHFDDASTTTQKRTPETLTRPLPTKLPELRRTAIKFTFEKLERSFLRTTLSISELYFTTVHFKNVKILFEINFAVQCFKPAIEP